MRSRARVLALDDQRGLRDRRWSRTSTRSEDSDRARRSHGFSRLPGPAGTAEPRKNSPAASGIDRLTHLEPDPAARPAQAEVQDALLGKKINRWHARALLGLPDQDGPARGPPSGSWPRGSRYARSRPRSEVAIHPRPAAPLAQTTSTVRRPGSPTYFVALEQLAPFGNLVARSLLPGPERGPLYLLAATAEQQSSSARCQPDSWG